jgi:hypothetical protein
MKRDTIGENDWFALKLLVFTVKWKRRFRYIKSRLYKIYLQLYKVCLLIKREYLLIRVFCAKVARNIWLGMGGW